MVNRVTEDERDRSFQDRIRFADVDFARLPFYGRYFYWFHAAYEEALREAGLTFSELIVEQKLGTPAVGVTCRYLRPMPVGERFRLDLRVRDFSPRGWTVDFRMERLRDGALAAEASVNNRFVDTTSGRGTEVAGHLLERLTAFANKHACWPGEAAQ